MLAFRIFEDSALKLRAVPEDDQGIDIEFLQCEIKKSEEKALAEGNNEPVSHHVQCEQSAPPLQEWQESFGQPSNAAIESSIV